MHLNTTSLIWVMPVPSLHLPESKFNMSQDDRIKQQKLLEFSKENLPPLLSGLSHENSVSVVIFIFFPRYTDVLVHFVPFVFFFNFCITRSCTYILCSTLPPVPALLHLNQTPDTILMKRRGG